MTDAAWPLVMLFAVLCAYLFGMRWLRRTEADFVTRGEFQREVHANEDAQLRQDSGAHVLTERLSALEEKLAKLDARTLPDIHGRLPPGLRRGA